MWFLYFSEIQEMKSKKEDSNFQGLYLSQISTDFQKQFPTIWDFDFV